MQDEDTVKTEKKSHFFPSDAYIKLSTFRRAMLTEEQLRESGQKQYDSLSKFIPVLFFDKKED